MTRSDPGPRPVTLFRRPNPARSPGGETSGFPHDLFEEARGRLRLLAGFFTVAFGFDLLVFVGGLVAALVGHRPVATPGGAALNFQWVNLGAVTISIVLGWAAGSPRVSAPRIHTLGLVYEAMTCLTVSLLSFWQSYLDTGALPLLTWVPAIVIMFPLVLPGPPRRMLAAAAVSAAMSPLGLFLLEAGGRIRVEDHGAYVQATVGPLFAVVFAYMGARVIYGLGREVAKARALGSYRLEERLGEGGMGEVWRARHRLLARPAAVKLIRPALAAGESPALREEARRRFEREAQVIASLRSPHTVDLFDFGVADDGSFYYAMELLEGLDADALVRRFGPVPAERAVFLLRQVCHSLSEAESRGLVHRDIKPANIFLCRYGEDDDFVKVLDFGLVTGPRDAPLEAGSTGTGHAIRGTPAYIAPEQVRGGVAVDGRADLYSLGCVAYWLVTGRPVFTADTPLALLLKHLEEEPVPPGAVSELPVPPALEAIILSCLSKDPGDRPPTAAGLADRLAAVDGAEGWTKARRREWWERFGPPRSADSPSAAVTGI